MTITKNINDTNSYLQDGNLKIPIDTKCHFVPVPNRVLLGKDIPLISIANLRPKKVIFNPPATIVYWDDGTKTVVKTSQQFNDEFDEEIGLAMAYVRKIYGSRSAFLKTIQSAERKKNEIYRE